MLGDIIASILLAHLSIGLHLNSTHELQNPRTRYRPISVIAWPALKIWEHKVRYGGGIRPVAMGILDTIITLFPMTVLYYFAVTTIGDHIHGLVLVVLSNLAAIALCILLGAPALGFVSTFLFLALYLPFNLIVPYKRR